MEYLWEGVQWNTGPTAYWTVGYEYKRDGADMKYRFYWRVWLRWSTSYMYDALYLRLFINGVRNDVLIKSRNTSETGWDYSGTTDWYTVANKTSGTTPFYCTIYDYNASSTMTTSDTRELNVVGAASVLGSIADFDIDVGFTAPITKYDESFYDILTMSHGGTNLESWFSVKNGQKLTLHDSVKETIYSLMSSVNSTSFQFTLRTLSGTTELGSSQTNANGYITNATPTMDASKVTYKDTNDATIAVTNNDQKIIQKKSTLAVTFEDAVGRKGATIKDYTISVHGAVQTVTKGGTYAFGVIDSSQDVSVTIKATDSRGNTVECEKQVTIIPWTTPTFTATLERLNNYEDTTYIKIDAMMSSVEGKNSMSGYYRSRQLDGEFGDWKSIAIGETVEHTYDKNVEWRIEIKVQDIFDSSSTIYPLYKGVFPLFIDTEKNAVGINDFPSEGEALRFNGGVMNACGNKVTNIGKAESDGDAVSMGALKSLILDMFYPVGKIEIFFNHVNPSTIWGGTWERLTDAFLYCAKDTDTIGATGGSQNHTHTLDDAYAYIGFSYNSTYSNFIGGKFKDMGSWRGTMAMTKMNGYTTAQYDNDWATALGGTTDSSSNMPPYIKVSVWKRTA